MNRRDWIKLSACASAALPLLGASKHFIFENPVENELRASSFGDDFLWGTACAAYQIEGAWDQDGAQGSGFMGGRAPWGHIGPWSRIGPTGFEPRWSHIIFLKLWSLAIVSDIF